MSIYTIRTFMVDERPTPQQVSKIRCWEQISITMVSQWKTADLLED